MARHTSGTYELSDPKMSSIAQKPETSQLLFDDSILLEADYNPPCNDELRAPLTSHQLLVDNQNRHEKSSQSRRFIQQRLMKDKLENSRLRANF